MALVDRISSGLAELRHRDGQLSLNDWAEYFAFGGNTYPMVQTTMGQIDRESVGATSVAGLKGSGPIFSLVLARLQAFSQVRFQWTRFQGSQPSDLFGTPELGVLERPWPGGTTSDLLARMEIYASVAGCAYVTRPQPDRLSMLRPDRVTIVMGSQTDADDPSEAPDVEIVGFIHTTSRGKMTPFGPTDVAYYAPIPDPDYRFLGMSWITPVIRDLQADSLATEHKARFFTNAAAQPYDSGVLTPRGWVPMGDVKVGDEVIGPDGKPRAVLGVYPQGEKDIYRLTFSSGVTVECCEDHYWQVANAYDIKRGTSRLMRLRDIIDGDVRYPSGPPKWSVPLTDPVEYEAQPLPIDPYLLGLLLGDGSFRSNGKGSGGVSLSTHMADADEVEAEIRPLLPNGVRITRRDRHGRWSEFYFRGQGSPRPNLFTEAIRSLGLFDVPGCEKTIPQPYLYGPVNARVKLLQGLIDSDGHVNRSQWASTGVRFSSTSRVLAEQVCELARSLGAVVSCKSDGGRRGTRREQWTVYINQLPEWIVPARLSRKRRDYRGFNRPARVQWIHSVELVRRAPAQCIKVDAADGLYVTDGFVVTHNTPNMAIKFDASVGIERVKQFKALLEAEHRGAFNAWKTLYLGGGADPVTIGSSFKDMDYAVIQGRAESRLAAAAGVPPSWVGFSEGLQGSSLNAGNFNSARRRFSDGTMVHLWTNAATSLEVLLGRPPGATLWFDPRVPFMREDAQDLADIQQKQSQTIRTLLDAGYKPASVTAAVANNDWSLLEHTGLYSVQLQPPGSTLLPATNGNAPNGKVAVGG